ncbi:hypothetical protein AGMMS50293_12260 [Spirochaetia bacterium]|nr:hypothetical protein AGMMS50293_12260 [Spirochaetia bacterium]
MKRVCCFFVLLGLIVFSAAAAGPVVTVINETGYDIYFLYFSPSDSDEWGEDLLGDEILESGFSFDITLPAGGKWDVLAEDEDGDSYTIMGISIQGYQTIIIDEDALE